MIAAPCQTLHINILHLRWRCVGSGARITATTALTQHIQSASGADDCSTCNIHDCCTLSKPQTPNPKPQYTPHLWWRCVGSGAACSSLLLLQCQRLCAQAWPEAAAAAALGAPPALLRSSQPAWVRAIAHTCATPVQGHTTKGVSTTGRRGGL
jgi:hypothetical protein